MREGKQVGLGRTQQLVQIDEPKASSIPPVSATKHVADPASKELAERAIASERAAVSETPDRAEQKTWKWGSSTFSDENRHLSFDGAQARKDTTQSAATAAKLRLPRVRQRTRNTLILQCQLDACNQWSVAMRARGVRSWQRRVM